jgi:hypothetical protein
MKPSEMCLQFIGISKVFSSVTLAPLYSISLTQLNALLSFLLCLPYLALIYFSQTKLHSPVSSSKNQVMSLLSKDNGIVKGIIT